MYLYIHLIFDKCVYQRNRNRLDILMILYSNTSKVSACVTLIDIKENQDKILLLLLFKQNVDT